MITTPSAREERPTVPPEPECLGSRTRVRDEEPLGVHVLEDLHRASMARTIYDTLLRHDRRHSVATRKQVRQTPKNLARIASRHVPKARPILRARR